MNQEMINEALAAGEIPKPKRERTQSGSLRRSPMKRGKAPRQRSHKQAEREAYLRGVREAFIFLSNRLDPLGAHCWSCGRKPRRLDLHHVVSRAQGGHDTPSNLELICGGPNSCHDRIHGIPFQKESAS